MTKPKKVNLTSSNLSEEKLAELHRVFPEAFSENKIDWNKLRAVLGDAIDERIEKFSFTWAGKSNAIKNVLIPSKATLKPAKDKSVKFDKSENLFIEGDNLEVLKLLQKAYFEKVKMIYIDPPYNTGGDFVYHDNFTAPLKNYLQQTGQVDAEGNKLQTNRETSGRYHSDWLSMMYPRLKLAWNLLRDDGVIFVSIDDNEVHHLRVMMNEIFGEENFLAQVTWKRKKESSNDSRGFSVKGEYILVYSKSENTLVKALPLSEAYLATSYHEPTKEFPDGKWRPVPIATTKGHKSGGYTYKIKTPAGKVIEREWAYPEESYKELLSNGRIYFGKNEDGIPQRVVYEQEMEGVPPSNVWDDVATNKEGKKELVELMNQAVFDTVKPTNLVRRMLDISTTTHDSDIILDFFAGSGTTAHAVMAQNADDGGNRKWVCVQLPEGIDAENEAYKAGYKTIAEVAKERIRRSAKMVEDEVSEKRGTYNGLREVYGYKEREIKEVQANESGYRYDFDAGFKVFKLTESNYPENQFEFDPEKSEAENKKAFETYLAKAKQATLFGDDNGLDVVYENIVKEGFSLNSSITENKIGKNNVYVVSDGERQLLVCLDKKIDDKTIGELTSKDYKGKVFICLDNALNDSAKANLGLNVELKTI